MPIPIIDDLPAAPAPTDSAAEFNAKAFPFVASLQGLCDQMNDAIEWINDRVGFTEIVNETTNERTLSEEDIGKYIRFTNTEPKTLLVGSLPGSAPAIWNFRNVGAGSLTISPAFGVTTTPNAGGSLSIPQHGTFSLIRISANVYELTGQTVAED